MSEPVSIEQLEAALAELLPELEGWEDLERLNIEEESKNAVSASITRWTNRKAALEGAVNALNTLFADGYPAPLTAQFSASVQSDLEEQQLTIGAALDRTTAIVVAATAVLDFKEA